MISQHEQKIDAELAALGVKANVVHVQTKDGYYRAVTTATAGTDARHAANIVLGTAYAKAYRYGSKQRDLGAILLAEAVRHSVGIALCHNDAFNKARGRVIAKGRLLKIMRGSNHRPAACELTISMKMGANHGD